MSTTQQSLCNCGCCKNGEHDTPVVMDNTPGLSSLSFRVGTHSSFKASMLKALAEKTALQKLSTRYDDDATVATLDAWATVLDVLSFYQERIINEGYLRTATERLSVLELARHISYKLAPGVAASTWLAFTMNEATGNPTSVVIPAGTKVQSIPGQDELPQIFETTEEFTAFLQWNAIPAQYSKKTKPGNNDTEVWIEGIIANVQPGDGLLFVSKDRLNDVGSEKWRFRKVMTVEADTVNNRTRLTWQDALGLRRNGTQGNITDPELKCYVFREKNNLFGYNAPDFRALSDTIRKNFIPSGLTGEYFNNISFSNRVLKRTDNTINFNWGSGSPDPLINADNFSVRWSGLILAPDTGTYTFYTQSDDGVKLWVNGVLLVNNPTEHGSTENSGAIWLQAGQFYAIQLDYFEMTGSSLIQLKWSGPDISKQIIPSGNLFQSGNYTNWPGFTIEDIAGQPETIHVDGLHSKILQDSWILLYRSGAQELYGVSNVAESSREEFTLTGKTTEVELTGELLSNFNTHVRDTLVYAVSEELMIANTPVDQSVHNDNKITLQYQVAGLSAEKKIILTGKRKRITITESQDGLYTFSVEGNATATRLLKNGDSLIITAKPVHPEAGTTVWTLLDSSGTIGTLTVNGDTLEPVSAMEGDSTVSELHIISSFEEAASTTVIYTQDVIANEYDTTTLLVYANVTEATHGETRAEVLGSGSGSKKFQRFEMKQYPLTYIAAATATGNETTLEIRVNDILWKEASTFYQAGPNDKIYTVTINDDGKVTVMFGDGITGARLPTGTENIKAVYRTGTGSSGLVQADQLSMLLTPQLGLSKVTNPVAASGAEDPETLENARENAPQTVLTMDRIVSLRDFENFTRAFAGIAKASADLIWKKDKQVVYITFAAADGSVVDTNSTLYTSLIAALAQSGHTYQQVIAGNYDPQTFSVSVKVKVKEGYLFEDVQTNVITALSTAFSFDSRSFGQDVTPAEIMSVVHSSTGVLYADLDLLNGTDPFAPPPHFRLVAETARYSDPDLLPAQLLLIDDKQITITEITT
ncbi:MAG: putative baseplate assembly protein [Bacteroidetes bacterium]|nr:putative baseplate assembly protein [Bacteroidota bacterium]